MPSTETGNGLALLPVRWLARGDDPVVLGPGEDRMTCSVRGGRHKIEVLAP